MEPNSKSTICPNFFYTAFIDIGKMSQTQSECIVLLTNEYVTSKYLEDIWVLDMLPPEEFPDAALFHSLMDDYSFDLHGVNALPPDESPHDTIFSSDYIDLGLHHKFPIIIQAPFLLFCDFLAVNMRKFISDYVEYLLNKSGLYKEVHSPDINLLLKKYSTFSKLFMLDNEADSFLEKNKADYKNLSYEEARSRIIQIYERDWFDYILLQEYCAAYVKSPAVYGAPGHFAAFRQRYQLFEEKPYIPKITNDAITEKNLLLQSFQNRDDEKFKITFHEFVKNIPSKKKKTIVRSHFSVFLADMLEMIIDNCLTIKKCKLCGRYFVPIGNNNIEYCSRKRGAKQTCRDIGPKQYSQNKLKNDKVKNELKRIYNRLRNQKERHPEQPEYAKQFEEFKQKSKQLEHSYRAGELSESEMMSALDIWKAR